MAYNALNNLIDAYIYANGVQAITGQILNGVLKQMVSQLGSGYHLMGVAGPETEPAANDYAMAYFAATAGEYTDFGGITLAAGEVAVLLTSGNGSWAKQTIYNVPTGTADLENTAGFITNAVTDLVNYYTKTEVDDTLADYPTLQGLATALADYYTKTEIDGQMGDVDTALADRYTKSETDTKLGDYYKKTETYDKGEVDSIVAALSRQEYIVAWDGLAAPDVSAIPAGVTVTYSGTPYTGTMAASASTVNKIYMVWNGVAYDMYGTSQDGGFSWVPMGTTTVDLSQYATKDEVGQLEHKVDEISNQIGFEVTPKSVGVSNLQQSKQKIDNATGKWITVTNNERYCIWIDIVPGITYTVTARAAAAVIAILAENTFGITGDDVQYATGFSGTISISANGTYTFIAPSDAKGLYFRRYNSGQVNTSPSSIAWEEYSSTKLEEIDGDIFQKVGSKNVLNIFADGAVYQHSLDSSGEPQESTNYNTTGFIPIKENTQYIASCDGYVCFYDSLKNMVGSRVQLTDNARTFTTPTSTKYFRFCGVRTVSASWRMAYINEGAVLGTFDEYVAESKYNKIDRNVSEIEGMESILYKDGVIPFNTFTSGGYIILGQYPGDVADVDNPVSRAGFKYGIIPVIKGETYIITGTGADAARLYAFIDPEYNSVRVATANTRVSDLEITAPMDGYLIVNFVTQYTNSLGKKVKESVIVEKETSPFYKGPFSGYGHRFAARYRGLQGDYFPKTELGQNTTYAEAIAHMDALVTAGGGYVTKTSIGTAEGTDLNENPYTIYEYAFIPKSANNTNVTDKRPVVMIDACLHGFEKTAFYGWYCFFKDLVENWEKNPSLAAIRSGVEIHFIPVANPWGFDRDERPNANGVNLNRNFDVPNWAETPSGSDASGAEPFDQAESAVIRDWLDAHPEAFLLIDTHTNGHFNAHEWVEANHLILVTGSNDNYHDELFNIGKTYIEDNTTYFAKDYNFEISPRFGQFHTNAINTTNGYVVVYGVAERKLLSVTLEGFNGLTVNEEQVVGFYGPTSQKINSEIFGNFLLNALECYVPKLPL